MSKDNYDVCDNCGRKRNEKTEPHCKDCGHDHTTTKRDYDRQLANNAKNVCEKCGYGWVDDKQPGCKKCGHDMSIKRELYKERQKTAFDIVADSFEKMAFNIVTDSFEKIAGVEYGFRAYNDPDGKLSKALSDASLNDDWDTEDDIRNQLKSKGSHDYGYKWSEKGIATLPYEYGHNDLRNLMDGKGTNKLKGYHPLKSGYTGESDGSSFLAGRESAQIMLNHYNDMLTKLPNESVYSEQKYNEVKGKHDALNAKIKDIESKKGNELGKYKKQYNDLYSKLLQENSSWENEPIAKQVFNIPGKIKHKKAVKNILNERKNVQDKMDEVRVQGGATQEDLDKLHQYRNEMYKATDRDIIEQYKLSLQKSLEDKNNNMYEWGWY